MERDERYDLMDHIRIVEKMLNLIQQACTSEKTFNVKLVKGYAGQAIAHLSYVKRRTDPGAEPTSGADASNC